MNEITATSLNKLSFPVFKLGKNKPINIDGVLGYETIYSKNDIEIYEFKVVDDTTINGDNLAKRRIQSKKELFKLNKAIFFLGDLIKLAGKNVWFIDSLGKLFEYKKNTVAKLKYYKVEQLIAIPTGGAIVAVVGLPTRYKILYYPTDKSLVQFAGILHFNMSTVFYGLYDKKYDESWRKV